MNTYGNPICDESWKTNWKGAMELQSRQYAWDCNFANSWSCALIFKYKFCEVAMDKRVQWAHNCITLCNTSLRTQTEQIGACADLRGLRSALTTMDPRPWALSSTIARDRECVGHEMWRVPSRATRLPWTSLTRSVASGPELGTQTRFLSVKFSRKWFVFQICLIEFLKFRHFQKWHI